MDGDLRTIFRRRLPHFHWNAIESGATGSGIPDSEYCAPGGRAFIAVRRRTLAGPRKGEAADELWLVRGSAAPRLRAGGLKALTGADTLALHWGGPGKWRWATIELILRGALEPAVLRESAE